VLLLIADSFIPLNASSVDLPSSLSADGLLIPAALLLIDAKELFSGNTRLRNNRPQGRALVGSMVGNRHRRCGAIKIPASQRDVFRFPYDFKSQFAERFQYLPLGSISGKLRH